MTIKIKYLFKFFKVEEFFPFKSCFSFPIITWRSCWCSLGWCWALLVALLVWLLVCICLLHAHSWGHIVEQGVIGWHSLTCQQLQTSSGDLSTTAPGCWTNGCSPLAPWPWYPCLLSRFGLCIGAAWWLGLSQQAHLWFHQILCMAKSQLGLFWDLISTLLIQDPAVCFFQGALLCIF